jgi:putative transcriptional regulator
MENNLRKLRGSKSQGEIAANIGITKAHYGYIEKGNRLPSLPVALRIADFFKVRIEDVFLISTVENRFV